MRKECWAIKSRHGFVNDPVDPSQPLRTAFFKTRKHALTWLIDNYYWVKQGAYPVKVKVTVTEV